MTDLSRRNLLIASSSLALAGCATAADRSSAETRTDPRTLLVDLDRKPDQVIPLWPGSAPGGENVSLQQHYVSRDNSFGLKDRAVHDVTNPTLTLFRSSDPNGAAILIIPGGGYKWVVVEKEGYEGARYFNRLGYHVYVMNYRLPHQGWAAGPDTPLQDAQRAVRLVRSRSDEDGFDADRIMVMGFSAGGHLAGSICQRFDADVYERSDEIDTLSARPDLGVLVYPVALMRDPLAHQGSRINLIGEQPTDQLYSKYDLTTAPNPEGPPVFLLHALDDDAVPVENSLELAAAARRAGVSAVIHVFEEGGHGFGLRGIDKLPVGTWPSLVVDWASRKMATCDRSDACAGGE